MKQIVKYLLIGLVGTFFLTGCSSKYNATAIDFKKDKNECTAFHDFTKKDMRKNDTCDYLEEYEIIAISAIGDSSPFRATAYNNSTFALLQASAEATMLKKNAHFAFVYPEQISNMSGVLDSTAKEFQKKCEIGIDDLFTFNIDPCKIHERPRVTYGEIAIFNGERHDVITYNAKDVIAYLKKNDLYDENVKPILMFPKDK